MILPFLIYKAIDNNYVSRADWLNFLGAYIGALGTVFLGVVSIYQNKQLHIENKRLQEQAFLFEYHPDMNLYSYSISSSKYSSVDDAIKYYFFISEETDINILNTDYDPEVDKFTYFCINFKFRNLNPKSIPKNIYFKNYLKICSEDIREIYDFPKYHFPLNKEEDGFYSICISCTYELFNIQNVEETQANCNAFLKAIQVNSPSFQMTIAVEDYQGLVEESRVSLNLDPQALYDGEVMVTLPCKDLIKYYTAEQEIL
ncbi:hypothetical protein [Faecalispora jeddahensis]|uniref:hypothetical protein n=1 Tax=Faecalispora jeddahensis TaxID=1414721 RepID=UPI001899A1D1|nr:hypothetical protein [Faecalispora jeddahensis]